MKMILTGRSKDRRSKASEAVVFAGAIYEHYGSHFTDDAGESILVCLFTWKAIDLREPVPSLKDDDRGEPMSSTEFYSVPVEAYEPTRFVGTTSTTTSKSGAFATQIAGSHYTDLKIQPLELTYANFGYAGLKSAIYTKINKYMTRNKDNEVEQLKKARHCLDILIEKAELQNENNS